MHLTCPHCSNPIEVVEDQAGEAVCPSCGSSVQLEPGRTKTWLPSHRPRTLDKFEFLEVLGVGAVGTVYKGHDTELDRLVAIKVPRAGALATQEEVDRFLREARNAAQLNHPSIVALYDAGQCDGICYLVSELVQGATLADRLSAGRFSFRQAAELMVRVAEAVDYAHHQGVIHRDLKPSNIMVDAGGQPHVMDFGLAKREAGEITITLDGQVLGTPAYMSPEQARGEAHRVDARSDVYSLGVILYELLTGVLPFRGNRRMLLMQVLHDEPRPPRRLNDHIPRDLETITLTAMAKEPWRRYATAQALADDLRCWLSGQPIRARPASAVERLWRWAKRNPRVATLSAAVLALLVTIAIGSSVATVVINRQREAATELATKNRLLAEQERDAKEEAEGRRQEAEHARKQEAQAREQAEAVSQYLVDAFRSPDPTRDGRTITVAELLDRAATQLARDFPDRPRIEGQLLNAIGRTYEGLGLPKKAVEVYTRARELRRNALGEDHTETLESMNNLAVAYQAAGQLDQALPLLEQTLEGRRAKLGDDHLGTLESMNNLAAVYKATGRFNKALPLHKHALERLQVTLGDDHPTTLKSMNNLGMAYKDAGQLDQAIPMLERVLERRRATLGDDHTETLFSMNSLAVAYRAAGRLHELLPIMERVLERRRATLGEDHPDTLQSLNNVAMLYQDVGQWEKALPLFEQTLERRRATLDEDHPSTLQSINNLAGAYQAAGQFDKAIRLQEQVLELRRAKLGEDHPDTLVSANNLARAYQTAAQVDKAVPLLERTLQRGRATLGDDHPLTLILVNNLAGAYLAAGQLGRALPLFEQTLEQRQAKLGEDHPDTLVSLLNLAAVYRQADQIEKALPMYERVLERRRAKLGDDHPDTLQAMHHAAGVYRDTEDLGKAERLFRECLGIRQRKFPNDWRTFSTEAELGHLMAGLKRFQESEGLLVAGFHGMQVRAAKIPPSDRFRLNATLEWIVKLYEAWDKPEQAEEWRAKLPSEQKKDNE